LHCFGAQWPLEVELVAAGNLTILGSETITAPLSLFKNYQPPNFPRTIKNEKKAFTQSYKEYVEEVLRTQLLLQGSLAPPSTPTGSPTNGGGASFIQMMRGGRFN